VSKTHICGSTSGTLGTKNSNRKLDIFFFILFRPILIVPQNAYKIVVRRLQALREKFRPVPAGYNGTIHRNL
jgi:hypothetical protein